MIDGFTIKGSEAGGTDTVFDVVGDGFIKNITLSNLIIDGEGDTHTDRKAFYGNNIAGT